jgi:hypothetical protein
MNHDNKEIQRLLESILAELRQIRERVVPAKPMSETELELEITKVLGVGREEIFNK